MTASTTESFDNHVQAGRRSVSQETLAVKAEFERLLLGIEAGPKRDEARTKALEGSGCRATPTLSQARGNVGVSNATAKRDAQIIEALHFPLLPGVVTIHQSRISASTVSRGCRSQLRGL